MSPARQRHAEKIADHAVEQRYELTQHSQRDDCEHDHGPTAQAKNRPEECQISLSRSHLPQCTLATQHQLLKYATENIEIDR
ncbi:MAG TPA: hypothetical protein VN325_03295 [Steroidobacteraceae bacterium]|nr:hypothetical protein [Steroidobacteraceae bacterium]